MSATISARARRELRAHAASIARVTAGGATGLLDPHVGDRGVSPPVGGPRRSTGKRSEQGRVGSTGWWGQCVSFCGGRDIIAGPHRGGRRGAAHVGQPASLFPVASSDYPLVPS